MPTKKKRLTQREKAERAKMKKELQAEGVLPPDKPRLNRKKFARETWAEWEEFLKRDPVLAEVRLLRAVEFMAGPGSAEDHPGADRRLQGPQDRD